MTIAKNSCAECLWYLLEGKCVAFPDGIPQDIWEGENKHERSTEGGYGIVFTSIMKAEQG